MATLDDIANDINGMASRLEEARDIIAQGVAEVMLEEKGREIKKTYARPIPTRAQYSGSGKSNKAARPVRSGGDKPAWKRSGALREEQGIVKTGHGKREVRNVGESAAYEGHLANLPTGRDGVNRSNDAATNAQRKGEARIDGIVESVLEKVVR